VTRAAVIRDPAIAPGIGQFDAIQAVAPSLGVEVSPFNVRDAGEIERTITAFSHSSNGGLIVTGGALAVVHRELIIALAARNSLSQRSTSSAFSSPEAASSPTGPISRTNSGALRATSIASSEGRNPLTCRCKRRQSTSW
jgi:hypothetical protein